jgi:hypothetical protein
MGCCGQRRAALAQGMAGGQPMPDARGPSVRIEFTQQASILIRGPATGRHYQFHPGAQTQQVDPRDAASLVKSGYFRAA